MKFQEFQRIRQCDEHVECMKYKKRNKAYVAFFPEFPLKKLNHCRRVESPFLLFKGAYKKERGK